MTFGEVSASAAIAQLKEPELLGARFDERRNASRASDVRYFLVGMK
jgi:hypothetical protein